LLKSSVHLFTTAASDEPLYLDFTPPLAGIVWDGNVLKTQTKVQPSLSWMARQIVSVARRNQSIALQFILPWISLLVVGCVFLWVVAEIAREALGPSTVEIDARRTTTPLSSPPRQEESGLAGDSPAGGVAVP
jgi:hypothetical protein